jgi:hypothetical protein
VSIYVSIPLAIPLSTNLGTIIGQITVCAATFADVDGSKNSLKLVEYCACHGLQEGSKLEYGQHLVATIW